MSVVEFLSRLADLDIRLWVEEGNLRFSAPDGAFTEEIKQQVVGRKPELIEFLSQAKKVLQEEIPIVDREQDLALSYAQQRLWFLYKLDPGSAAYNIPAAIRIRGELCVERLQQVISEIVRRHEVLRTTFKDSGDESWQLIQEHNDWLLEIEPLPLKPDEDMDNALLRLVAEESYQPFNLKSDSVLRTRLIQMGDNDFVFLATLHHIASDGWSMGVLIGEIATLYNAFSQKRPSPLPELSVQYADYAAWQRTHISDDKLEQQLTYWHTQLADVPALALPTDKPRPALMSYSGDFHSLSIDKTLTAYIQDITRAAGATTFMTLLSTYLILLSRYNLTDDFCIGTPVTNRGHTALEPLIGCFINTLAIRTELQDNPTFNELLDRLVNSCKEAFANQDVPFEHVVDQVVQQRNLSSTPLFQAMFTLQNTPADRSVTLPGVTLEPVEIGKRIAKCDLSLCITEEDEQLNVEFEYRTDLFEAATIERMGQHFEELLRNIVSDPTQSINTIGMLSEDEKHLLINHNAAYSKIFSTQTIHQRFEQVASRFPEQTAISDGNESISYAELNARANQLARALSAHGVAAGDFVGLCLDRSINLLVGLLGILKAGGAYIPLDPHFPADRLGYILLDSNAAVLVTNENLKDSLINFQGKRVFIDSDWQRIVQHSGNNLDLAIPTESTAYVLYTSGTTGKPKGCLVSHSNVSRLFSASDDEFNFNKNDVWTLFHSYAFDFSVWEMWGALFYGGKLVIVPYSLSQSPEEFYQLLCQEQVTVLNQTPSAFSQLIAIDAAQPGDSALALRYIIFGGEALDFNALKIWVSRHGLKQPQLINMYGITETTVHVTLYHVTEEDITKGSSIIGRPISDLQCYILDPHGQLTPTRVPGEINVSGAGVTDGYLKRDDLTKEKFIPNPFVTKLPKELQAYHTHLYRSGDLGRYLPDGNIEYLGRIDQQVKIRGHRIELGEIEVQLVQLPQVREAVLSVHEVEGDKRLIAHILLAEADTEIDLTELRQQLKVNLPEYMIPSAFIVLDAWPLTPTGKVDKNALPSPTDEHTAKAPYEAPRNKDEQCIADIWQQVLGHSKVSIHDNFFEIGGHSLLATQVITRISEHYDCEIPLRVIFEQPTVIGLSDALQTHIKTDSINITAVSREQPLALSFAQQRLWIMDRLQPGSAVYNIPFGFSSVNQLDQPALEQAFTSLLRRHETLRTTIIAEGKDTWQLIHKPEPWTLDCESIERNRNLIAQRATEFAAQPFDLIEGPLMRTLLLQPTETDGNILLICLHHIIADGWSVQVFSQDLLTLYQHFCQQADNTTVQQSQSKQSQSKQSQPLIELPIQYVDYAAWQREYLSGDSYELQVDYWRKQLDGISNLELPTDRPRTPLMSDAGKVINFEIDSTLSDDLRQLSQANGATLFMTLLAAFQLLLARYSGTDDVAVGSTSANRPVGATESLIGFFVNTVVLRNSLNGANSFTDLLQTVKQTCIDSYQHQDVPFERLVDELQVPRDMTHTPLFQVMFTLLSHMTNNAAKQADAPFQVLDLQQGQHETVCKFDLSLGLTDVGQGTALQASMEYRCQLFDPSTIERMIEHFLTMLRNIEQQPTQTLSQISMLTNDEEQHLLLNLNASQSQIYQTETLHHRFEKIAQQYPDRIAVKLDNKEICYTDLNARANQLARALGANGVSVGQFVGICMDRSIELLVGLLGILKAGAAYIPLDPHFPTDRLSYILEDSEAPVLITHQQTRETLTDFNGRHICIGNNTDQQNEYSHSNLNLEIPTDTPAYVLYTSGTTGKPKGCLVSHANVSRLFSATDCYFGFHERDIWTLFHSYAFDFTVWEIWGALLYGGKLIVVPYLVSRSPEEFYHLLENEKVTVLNQTPSAFSQLIAVDTTQPNSTLSLRSVIFGGEALDFNALNTWTDRYGFEQPQLINMYGITETTVHVTYYRITEQDIANGMSVIGKPMTDLHCHILDPQGQLTPYGVPGEIHVSGGGVANGYLNRDSLTAEKFIPNPFADKLPGEQQSYHSLLYRSGDKGRYLDNGNIEYYGRIDQQVKIRGHRIELGEIEAQLSQLPQVREAVVSINEDFGDKRLIAHILLPNEQESTDISELRQQLKVNLPDYMIPSAFIILKSWPLTPTGKVDKKALPAPEDEHFARATYIAPQTDTQQQLATIWQDILNIEKIGIHDNFFEIGGHSLLATQATALAQDHYAVEVELRRVFEQPTIEAIATLIDQALAEKNLLLETSSDGTFNNDQNDLDDDEEELVI